MLYGTCHDRDITYSLQDMTRARVYHGRISGGVRHRAHYGPRQGGLA